MAQETLSPTLRRLIKKIEESGDAAARATLSELPKDLDNETLLEALLPTCKLRPDFMTSLLNELTRKNLKDYAQSVQAVLINWAGEHLESLQKEELLAFTKWMLRDLYHAEEMHQKNASLAPFSNSLTSMMHADSNAMLALMQKDFYLFDMWVATITDEQIVGVCPVLATQLHEDNLIRLFTMLSTLPSYESFRGGQLPHKPWLKFVQQLWQSELPTLENIACAFIKGWQVDQNSNDLLPQMLKILATTPDDLRSHVKAGLFKFSTPYTQYLAKKSEHPTFDPVTCYQIVNRAEPDTTYEATKWAMQFADTAKLSDLVNAVTEDVVKGTSSVLRRYPAFFLLVHSLCKCWEDTLDVRKDDFAKAVHALGRHWSQYRPQFEKEAEAEGQTHYFSSNAEEVEKSLVRVLARTPA